MTVFAEMYGKMQSTIMIFGIKNDYFYYNVLNKIGYSMLIIKTSRASNTSLQRAESVDFNNVGFVLIESTVFEIFGIYMYVHSS